MLGEPLISKFKFYSAGIVAENKLISSKQIEVTPIEEIPFTDGELSSHTVEIKAKAKDASQASYENSVKSTVTINATWLSLSVSNRLTAPDVRRGEMVMLYQFGDTDMYYWTTLKEDIALRRLETVIYGFSASKVEDSPVNPETIYYIEISTHKKLIHLHTCKADGEPFGYDIQLNTKEGYLVITDDVGNYIHLNSAEQRIELKNLAGSHYDMKGPSLNINIPSNIKMEAGASILITSPNTTIN